MLRAEGGSLALPIKRMGNRYVADWVANSLRGWKQFDFALNSCNLALLTSRGNFMPPGPHRPR